jgi:hypothetical protein
MIGKPLRALIGIALLLMVGSVLFNLWPREADVPRLNLGVATIDTAPPCPWREPESDLAAFFPGATGYQTENRILSAKRLELARRLGRMPTAEENSLRAYCVYRGEQPVGHILMRRAKGQFGAIEIVLAVAQDGEIAGIRLQRQREPEVIRAALQSPAWLNAFSHQTARSDWRLGQAIPDVPNEARASAQAVVENVRSLLILLDTVPDLPIQHAHPQDLRR